MALAALHEQLALAREHALLGEYSTSVVYYERCLPQITKCGQSQRQSAAAASLPASLPGAAC
jgi:hypothetical protein